MKTHLLMLLMACWLLPIGCAEETQTAEEGCVPGSSEDCPVVCAEGDEGACDDGDPCTSDDACSDGACAGAPLDCFDGNPCTDDSCDDGGCAWTPLEADCDDGDACSIASSCADSSGYSVA